MSRLFRLFIAPLVALMLVATAHAEPVRVLILGDSLTAGFGLPKEAAFPAHLQTLAEEAGFPVEIVNAGVSGETTAGGLRRVNWMLRQPVDIFVLALGGNDVLRGFDPQVTRDNLTAILEQVVQKYPDATLVLAGMLAPPNMGAEYQQAFAAVYPEVAKAEDAVLIPFLLEGVAGDAELNLPDGIHPNAAGHRAVAAHVWTFLEPLLDADVRAPDPASPAREGADVSGKP